MGAYGTPELKGPEYRPKMPKNTRKVTGPSHYRNSYPLDLLNVCHCCGQQYHGLYCPYCGTKVGKKSLRSREWRIFSLGIVVGAILFFFGSTMGGLFR